MEVYTHDKYKYVHVAKISKNEIEKIDFALAKQPKETLAAFYNRQTKKPAVLTNGGFFAMSTGETSFNFKDEKKTIASNQRSYKWGFGIIGDTDLRYGELNSKDWRDFISGFPVLLDNGNKCSYDYAKELDYQARRTAIGYNENTVFLVCVENPGMNFTELQNLMLDIGCKYAINLDGGGSTKMIANGKTVTKNWTNRAIDNVVAVYLKENKKTIYRSLVGPYSNILSAYKALSKIKKLGKTFSDSFVKKLGNEYNIQVGAFELEDNANNRVRTLKSRGFNGFVMKE